MFIFSTPFSTVLQPLWLNWFLVWHAVFIFCIYSISINKHYVCLPVCNVDKLWSHEATERGNRHITSWLFGWLIDQSFDWLIDWLIDCIVLLCWVHVHWMCGCSWILSVWQLTLTDPTYISPAHDTFLHQWPLATYTDPHRCMNCTMVELCRSIISWICHHSPLLDRWVGQRYDMIYDTEMFTLH